ncbi:MAG TPA: sulfurtransferase [Candidatus Dormibacteraeota bacterium]|nr:sulfurtransferase [Candidatus Dormibacteraeota bacterium]
MSESLISVGELAGLIDSGRAPLLLDVRWSLAGPPGRDEYLAGHLAGAHFVDLDRDLAAPPGQGRGRHPLPEAAVFEAAMRRCGVDDGSAVVVYDASGGVSAARAWWLLRYFGHGRVRLLDGGVAAWTAAGLPLTTTEPSSASGSFSARPGGMPVVGAAAAARVARDGVLLDARAAERYRGDQEPIDPVAGHIPGARSAPTLANLGADGRFLEPAVLRARFAAMGATPASQPVGAYCGSGVTAAHEVLALELAGITAALYPGSWSEWISDPARPVAAGPQPG